MSLRISDLPSNLERLRSGPTLPPLPSLEAPALEPEMQVAAMCQQLSRDLQLLSEGPPDSPPGPSLLAVSPAQELPAPDQWLGRLTGPSPQTVQTPLPLPLPLARAPPLVNRARSLGGDPFDAEWAAPPRTTNPFLQRAI